MGVAVIASSGSLGGAELSLLGLLERRAGELDPLVVIVGDGPLRERVEALGLPVHTTPELASRPGPAAAARFARELRALLRRHRPGVAWAVGIKACALSAASCRSTRTPLIWHKVDFSHDARLARPLAWAATGVAPVSEATGEAVPARRLVGVAPPVLRLDEGLRASPDPAHPTIATLGRLVPYKGHHLVIAAAGLLRDELPGLRVVIAGQEAPEYPDYPAALRTAVKDAGLEGQVEMPGFVSTPELLSRLSVFVNPTFRDEHGYGLEGLGQSMIEAAWAGVPVVATGGGGATEAFRPGVTGTLLQNTEPRAIAEAVGAYLRDPELARRTGEAGRAFARERYDPAACAERVTRLLARCERPAAGSAGGSSA